ncbi:uncharacterized protein M6B38_367805 [Iris pallida]|uniref:BSD domain-containing protein n=1 Tax=Iris pallida TaxID=29817 RepID=A0AAX6GEG3_IRIPA|nr:uncharacterized protein M6B38_367805 [Iris pallida]
MSWLARTLANSMATPPSPSPFRPSPSKEEEEEEEEGSATDPELHGRGVKEDLSELTETLTRQFWGVASFLAPPPPPSDPSDPSSSAAEDPDADEASTAGGGIGGRFRSGIGRIATNFIPTFGPEEELEEEEEYDGEEEEEVVGVTEEVMAFARNIAMHPETWLDFPLFAELEDINDFEMSCAQQEHAFAVESLAPRFLALRIELCPTHMTEGCFWKIYFVLLHSRLNKHDAELLTTPQIAEARALLLQKLQNRNKVERDTYRSSHREQVKSPSYMLPAYQSEDALAPVIDFEIEKHTVHSTKVEIVDKSVINEGPAVHQSGNKWKIPIEMYEDDDDEDDWLEDDDASGDMGISRSTIIPLGNVDDVSFSDLEEDDDPRALQISKYVTSEVKDSSSKVQFNTSSDR